MFWAQFSNGLAPASLPSEDVASAPCKYCCNFVQDGIGARAPGAAHIHVEMVLNKSVLIFFTVSTDGFGSQKDASIQDAQYSSLQKASNTRMIPRTPEVVQG